MLIHTGKQDHFTNSLYRYTSASRGRSGLHTRAKTERSKALYNGYHPTMLLNQIQSNGTKKLSILLVSRRKPHIPLSSSIPTAINRSTLPAK